MGKSSNVIQIVVCSLTLILCVMGFTEGHNWGGDFSLYIHQAKSMVEGGVEGLGEDNRFAVENSSVHTFSPVLYPWGFPMLLAPLYAVFGLDYFVFKVLMALLYAGSIWVIFLIFRDSDRLGKTNAMIILGIMAFHPVYTSAADQVLSGLPYLFFSFLGLYLITVHLEGRKGADWKFSILTGLVLFFCFYTRTEGIGLFIALFAGQVQYLFFNKEEAKSRLVYFGLPYLGAGVCYMVCTMVLPSGYTSHFSYKGLIGWDTVLLNIQTYSGWMDSQMFGVALVPFFIYIVLVLGVLGIVNSLRQDFVLIVYFVFLLVLFAVWPFRELRYLYSIFPFVLYFFARGVVVLQNKWSGNPLVKYVCFFLLALCLTTNIVKTISHSIDSSGREGVVDGPETVSSQEMFEYILDNTPENAVIGFFKPRVMHLYAGRRALALFDSMDEIMEKADYYVEYHRAGNYFQIPISQGWSGTPQKNEAGLKLVFSNPEFNVFRIVK